MNKFFEAKAAGEWGETADMIVVVVSDDQVIDLLDAGVLDGRHDAPRITNRTVSTVTRIDKHRFSGRRDKKDGIAALHIDHVDVQRFRSLGLCNSKRGAKDEKQQERHHSTHQSPPT